MALLAAAPVQASPSDEAEALMKKGNELRHQGDDEGALPLFRQAFEIFRSPRTTAQLGLVESALGRWVDADEHLTEALRSVKTHEWVRANRDALEEAARTAKLSVARVEINGDPAGAEVMVNGRVVGTLPLGGPVKVTAGSVDIELRAPGYRSTLRSLTVAGMQYQPVVMRLEKVADAPGSALAGGERPAGPGGGASAYETDLSDRAGMASWRKVVIGAALGGAGLALATGGYGIWRYNDRVDAFNQRSCLNSPRGPILASTLAPDGLCNELKDSFESARTLSIVGFSAAGALGLTALVLYLTDGRAGPGRSSAKAGPHLACAPDLAGRGALCALPF